MVKVVTLPAFSEWVRPPIRTGIVPRSTRNSMCSRPPDAGTPCTSTLAPGARSNSPTTTVGAPVESAWTMLTVIGAVLVAAAVAGLPVL